MTSRLLVLVLIATGSLFAGSLDYTSYTSTQTSPEKYGFFTFGGPGLLSAWHSYV